MYGWLKACYKYCIPHIREVLQYVEIFLPSDSSKSFPAYLKSNLIAAPKKIQTTTNIEFFEKTKVMKRLL
jgi:hypothetical protein